MRDNNYAHVSWSDVDIVDPEFSCQQLGMLRHCWETGIEFVQETFLSDCWKQWMHIQQP